LPKKSLVEEGVVCCCLLVSADDDGRFDFSFLMEPYQYLGGYNFLEFFPV